MKKLITITFCVLMAATLQAANYWEFPQVMRLYDTSKMLIYTNASGSRTITGLQLKQEISAFARLSTSKRIADATAIYNLMTTGTANKLIKRASPTAGTYDRVVEIKDKTGKIVYYVTQNGVIHAGTPRPLSIDYVWPPNGATDITNSTMGSYSSAYTRSYPFNKPSIVLNKGVGADISSMYISGNTAEPTSFANRVIWTFTNFSGAPGATYTIRFLRGNIVQTDGELSSSCGAAMTDVAGVCQSTFTMR